MKPELRDIIEENVVHSLVLNHPSIEKCAEKSYNLGVTDVLDWLSKKDYLTDKLEYIIEEWSNQNLKIKS
jgi:hypothetical protein